MMMHHFRLAKILSHRSTGFSGTECYDLKQTLNTAGKEIWWIQCHSIFRRRSFTGNFSKCRFLHQLRDRKEFIEMTMQNIQETKKSDSSVDGCWSALISSVLLLWMLLPAERKTVIPLGMLYQEKQRRLANSNNGTSGTANPFSKFIQLLWKEKRIKNKAGTEKQAKLFTVRHHCLAISKNNEIIAFKNTPIQVPCRVLFMDCSGAGTLKIRITLNHYKI